MPYSMTGFARSEHKSDWGSICCEVKSVNHRFLDIYFRMPDSLREFELDLRNLIKGSVSRGKIECSIQVQINPGHSRGKSYDAEAANAVIEAAEAIARQIDSPAAINPLDVLRMPGVSSSVEVESQELFSAAKAALNQALEQHRQMRLREGNEMSRLVEQRIDAIAGQVSIVKTVLPEIRKALKQRLLDRLDQLNVETDADRLEQELVYQAQRIDVDEEIDRLETHMQEVRNTLKEDQPIGRRLDFLMQELNREANTLGSKSQAVESTNVSIELKVLIEQMREQIQNIE
ncbi:MAG: YicC/YloC family endoribonuclease [Porticoccaceae bacterium]